ncbi:hypothetical protein BGZ59_002936 [Podila verticillata]|nr:hypothetical protein BGZ59_002936 [Podila verticillata]
MAYIYQETLTGFSAIRPPTRSNQFTVNATATLDKETVVLQEARNVQGRGIREHIDTWRHILSSEELTTRESHLVQVKGLFTLPLPRSIAPLFVPKSFRNQSAATASLEQRRPIYVTKYYERGSLRDCLDKAEFISMTNPASSNWHGKIAVLKNVATALHNIQLHMQGQSHGGVSSRSVLLDKDGRAFLSWHQSDKSRQDLLSNSNNLRYYSQAVLKSINGALVNNVLWNTEEVLEINHDDMYSFGILAWEIATDELPYQEVESPSPQQLLFQNHNRFTILAPAPLQQLIDHCTHSELDQRPSWCTVVAELDALNLQELSDLEIEANQGDQAVGGVMVTEEQASTVITVTGVPEQDPKSEVVEMMESVLNSTFYRRELPPHLDSFTSASGKRLFKDMILEGTGENFFRMFTSFNTQSDPAFCGVSSLSMVLNALEIDPRKQWRGVWRWYSDEQLDCCASIEEMKLKGITFNQFACLARCHAKVIVKRADRHSLEEFRRDVQMVSQSSDYQLVISFSRAALGQTGSGHFSPIGGYHAGEDKVLVLDTARFKYPPFWATVAELWESLLPEDPETGLCRGYFVISATSKQKLEIQKQKMQNQLSSSTSASSSSVSLPLLPDPISRPNSPSPTPFDAMVVVPKSVHEIDAAAIVGEGDRSECDCSCPKKVVDH